MSRKFEDVKLDIGGVGIVWSMLMYRVIFWYIFLWVFGYAFVYDVKACPNKESEMEKW